MEKRLVQREKTFGVAWENAKNDLKTSWQTHGKTPVAVWKNAWYIMGKRLVHHGIAKDANKDKGKGLLTL